MRTLIFCTAMLVALAFPTFGNLDYKAQPPVESTTVQHDTLGNPEALYKIWMEVHFVDTVRPVCYTGLALVFMEDKEQVSLLEWGTFIVGDCARQIGGEPGPIEIHDITNDRESPGDLRARLAANSEFREQILDWARKR